MLRYGLEAGGVPPEEEAAIEARIRTGRPLSDEAFVEAPETLSGRQLEAPQPGPRPRS
jgi:putative transposase